MSETFHKQTVSNPLWNLLQHQTITLRYRCKMQMTTTGVIAIFSSCNYSASQMCSSSFFFIYKFWLLLNLEWSYVKIKACVCMLSFNNIDSDNQELKCSSEANKDIKHGQKQLSLSGYSVDNCDPLSSFWCSHIWCFSTAFIWYIK